MSEQVRDRRRLSGAPGVVMIVRNEVRHDGRVVKIAGTLASNGYEVLLLGMSATERRKSVVTSVKGIKTVIVPKPGARLPFSSRRKSKSWERTVRHLEDCMFAHVEEAAPRYLHTHDCNVISVGKSFVSRLRRNGHTVHWLHDFHEWVAGFDNIDVEWRNAMLRHEEQSVSDIDHCFTVSPAIAERLEARYRLDRRPTVLLNAPSLEAGRREVRSTLRRDIGLGPDEPLIVYTGGVSRIRGLHTVVEALAANPRWHLALVTNDAGAYVDELKQIAAAGGYAERLHFLPYVDPELVAAYVRDASVGVHPISRYGNSVVALPNKLFDYLHAGLPVVVSNCDLMQAFVTESGIGAVFEAGNVDDCATVLGDTLARRVEYARRIANDKQLLHRCSWEAQEIKILDAYRELAEAAGSSP